MGSNNVVKQLLFCKLPSILTFHFDLIFGLFMVFLGQMVYFWGLVRVHQRLSTHKALQLLFSTFPLIMTFKFGSFLAFWGPMGIVNKVK